MKIATPTAKQAQAYWLSVLGFNSRQIGEIMHISTEAAQSALVQGRKKAKEAGLKVTIENTTLANQI